MFCYIHEGAELVKGMDGSTQYVGDHTISIKINQHISYDDFISIVCGALKMLRDQVKIEFTIKFASSSLILLYDDSSFMRMLTYNEMYCRVYVSSCGGIDGELLRPTK